jgi:hypothetical protein
MVYFKELSWTLPGEFEDNHDSLADDIWPPAGIRNEVVM